MEKSLKSRWVEALRSGRYAQARRSLRVSREGGTGFCCLGVLCDISDPTKWEKSESPLYQAWSWKASRGGLWREQQLEFGLDMMEAAQLARMNDSTTSPKTFHQIADWIEKNIATPEVSGL